MVLEELYAQETVFSLLSEDRIQVRAYEKNMCYAGGFYTVAKTLRPNAKVVASQSWIGSLARRFHEGVRNFAGEHAIPIVTRKKRSDSDERLEDLAKRYRADFKRPTGVYLIVKQQELVPSYRSERCEKVADPNYRYITRPKCLVYQYYYYLVDATWGEMCVKFSSNAPFQTTIWLNAHHWLAHQASESDLKLESFDNGILRCDDPATLQRLADRLSESHVRMVCDEWLYRLFPVFTERERMAFGFRYEYSQGQYERSHSLVFRKADVANDLFQRLIDANRRHFGAATIKTIFSGTHLGAHPKRLSTTTKRTKEGLTTFKVQHKKSVLRQYNKYLGEMLRTELCVNDPDDLGLGKGLSNFAALRTRADAILEDFQKREYAVFQKALPRGVVEEWAKPTHVGRTKVAGLRIDNKRVLAVAESIVAATHCFEGFANRSLREDVRQRLRVDEDGYKASQLSYDLRKFQAQRMVERIDGTNRYRVTNDGLPRLLALLQLRQGLLDPLLSASTDPSESPCIDQAQLDGIEARYKAWADQLHGISEALSMPLQN